MMYLIVGRTGTGKSHLGVKLQEHGLKPLKSYTTRPRRTINEDTYHFIEKHESDNYTDKAATTVLNGYDYFARSHQIEESDYYIVDPNGVYELIENKPNTNFHIIYIHADLNERRDNAIKRVDEKDKEKEATIFDARNADEDKQFSDFEKRISGLEELGEAGFPKNIRAIHTITNDYTDDVFDDRAVFFLHTKNRINAMTKLVELAIENNLLVTNKEGHIRVKTDQEGMKMNFLPIEFFADMLLYHKDQMYEFLMEVFAHSDLSDIK